MSQQATDSLTVTVDILGREYQVACRPDERDALQRAARHLDENMREIRSSGKIVGSERIAVMAALNLSHQLLSASTDLERTATEGQRRVDRLSERVGSVLEELKGIRAG